MPLLKREKEIGRKEGETYRWRELYRAEERRRKRASHMQEMAKLACLWQQIHIWEYQEKKKKKKSNLPIWRKHSFKCYSRTQKCNFQGMLWYTINIFNRLKQRKIKSSIFVLKKWERSQLPASVSWRLATVLPKRKKIIIIIKI